MKTLLAGKDLAALWPAESAGELTARAFAWRLEDAFRRARADLDRALALTPTPSPAPSATRRT